MNQPTESPDQALDETPDRRNELALIRTDLANERTLLAYVRTSLMMAGTGGTLIKFFADSKDLLYGGFGLLGLGFCVFVIGAYRYRSRSKRIR